MTESLRRTSPTSNNPHPSHPTRCKLEPLEPRRLFALTPLGTDLRIDTSFPHPIDTTYPMAMASDSSGNIYLAVTLIDASRGGRSSIWGAKLNSSGSVVSTFPLSVTADGNTTVNRIDPDIAVLPTGGFVATWTDDFGTGTSNEKDVYVRSFAANGQPNTSPIRVNSSTQQSQQESSIGIDANGRVLIAYSNYINANFYTYGSYRFFDSNLNPLTANLQLRADNLYSNAGVTATYKSLVSAIGSEFFVYSQTRVLVGNTSIADGATTQVDVTSSFNSKLSLGGNSEDLSSFVMYPSGVFAATGAQVAYVFNSSPSVGEVLRFVTTGRTSLANLGGGTLVAVYPSLNDPNGTLGITARQFTINGNISDSTVPVSTTTAGDQTSPMIVASGDQLVTAFYSTLPGQSPQILTRAILVDRPTPTISSITPVVEGQFLALQATSTNPDGNALEYSWDLNGDNVFTDAFGSSPIVTAESLSTFGLGDGPLAFNVRVRVDDGAGNSGTSSPSNVIVLNAPPTATLSASATVEEGQVGTVNFGNQRDVAADQSASFSYSYDFDNNNTFEISNTQNSSATIPASFLADGPSTRTIHARIIDKDGGFTDYRKSISVTNRPPTADFSTPNANALSPVTLTTTTIDPSSVDAAAGFSHSWTVSFGGSVVQTGSGPVFTFTPNEAGDFAITLVSIDKDGAASAPVTKTLSVGAALSVDNQAPTATIVPITPPLPTSPFVDISIAFGDNTSLDSSTIGDTNLSVTTPDNLQLSVPLLRKTGSGTLVIATYRLPAPNGSFSPGNYTARILTPSVRDIRGNAVPAGISATFTVTGTKPPPKVGATDPNFGNGSGAVSSLVPSLSVRVLDSFALPDNAILTAGLDAASQLVLSRFSADGTLDTTFASGGSSTIAINSAFAAQSLAFDPDGKILLTGIAGASALPAILRLNQDGTPDSTLAASGPLTLKDFTADDIISAARTTTKGKFIVAGSRSGGGSKLTVARINPDGSLDKSFGSGGQFLRPAGLQDNLSTLTLGSKGEIVVAGTLSNQAIVIRLTAGGKIDRSFAGAGAMVMPGNSRFASADKVLLQSDGKVIFTSTTASSPTAADDGDVGAAVIRLTPKGVLDSTFTDSNGQSGVVIVETNPLNTASAQSAGFAEYSKVSLIQRAGILQVVISQQVASGSLVKVTQIIPDGSELIPQATLNGKPPFKKGSKKTVTLKLSNVGTLTTSGLFSAGLVLSTDNVLSSDDTLLLTKDFVGKKLKPGVSSGFNLTFNLPSIPGNYTLFARFSSTQLADLNPDNNSCLIASNVNVT